MPVNKVKRRGSYAPLSAHYYKDDRLIRASEKAELLYVRALAFCADVLNDGFITDAQLAHVGVGLSNVKARAKALVDVGAWQRGDGGYQVVAWLAWNKCRADILDDAKKDTDRKTQPGSEQALPPEPPPDELPDEDPYRTPDDNPEGRIPNGIRTESGSRPDGFHTLAGAPAPAPSNSRAELELPLPTGGGAGEPEAALAGETQTAKKTSANNGRRDAPPMFEEFWDAWPRKTAKTEARKKFAAAIARGADPARIVESAKAHAEQWRRENKEVQYIPHATTWLNQGRYEDAVERADLRLVSGGDSPWGTWTGPESPWAKGWG